MYLNYLEQATLDANASIGFDRPRRVEISGMFVIRQHDVEYLHPATYGDRLDIVTWIGEVSNNSVHRHTTMRDQGSTLVLRAQTRWVWIDLKTREAAAIPTAVREALTNSQ